MINFKLGERTFHNPDTGIGEGLGTGQGAPAQAAPAGQQAAPAQGKPVFEGPFIQKKDPVNGNVVNVPAEIEAYIGHMISTTRNSIEGQYKPLVESLEGKAAQVPEIEAELQKLKEASMSAEEKAQTNAARKIAEFETIAKIKTDEATKWKAQYDKATIENSIYGAFGDTKLCNAKQTALLMESEGMAKVVEDIDSTGKHTGRYNTILELQLTNENGGLETVTGSPQELFKRWIGEERNLHHQMNNLIPGGNSSSGSRKSGSVDYAGMNPTERLNAIYKYGEGK